MFIFRRRFAQEQLHRAHRDLDRHLADIRSSDYNGFHNALQRYLRLLDQDPVLSRFLGLGDLPAVDFESWYAEAQSTFGGMAGSGRLEWPLDDGQRLAMQKLLLDAIASRQIDLGGFTSTFMNTGSPQLSTRVQVFVERVVEPFSLGLLRRLEDAPRRTPLARHLQRLIGVPVKWAFQHITTVVVTVVGGVITALVLRCVLPGGG